MLRIDLLCALGAFCALIACPVGGADTAAVPLPPTGPNDLPALDRSVLPKIEERWDEPAEREAHRRIMDQLWATRLGQIYLAYLTEPMAPVAIPGHAKQIVEMIFDDGVKAASRVRVLQLLTQDMGAREKLDLEVLRRVVIFQQKESAKESAGVEDLKRVLVNSAITTAVVSAPFGFLPLSEEASKLYNLASRWVYCRERCAEIELKLRRFIHLRGYGRWHLGHFLGIFNRWFGPVSALYWAKNDWLPAWLSRNKSDPMLSGQDHLLENADF